MRVNVNDQDGASCDEGWPWCSSPGGPHLQRPAIVLPGGHPSQRVAFHQGEQGVHFLDHQHDHHHEPPRHQHLKGHLLQWPWAAGRRHGHLLQQMQGFPSLNVVDSAIIWYQGPLPRSLSGEDEKEGEEGEQEGRPRDLPHSGLWRQDCEGGKVVNCNDLLLTVNNRKKKYICLFASSDATQHLWFEQ